jgi:fimbrial chaperone protein
MNARNCLRLGLQASLLVGLLAAAGIASAGSFTIAPIRAELSAAHRTEVLTLTNASDEAVVVEVHIVKWSQDGGAEQLDDTRDVLATPPVLQIPGNSNQIVRVALRQEPDAMRELTYRIIFQEVPQTAAPDFNGLRLALRLSVPIFVAPAHAKRTAELSWEVHGLPSGELEVAATNHGNAHLHVTDFDVEWPGTDAAVRGITAKYVLPDSRMVWTLQPPAGAAKQGPLTIHGHSDQGDFSADITLSGP